VQGPIKKSNSIHSVLGNQINDHVILITRK
jgi:hypothetical protein